MGIPPSSFRRPARCVCSICAPKSTAPSMPTGARLKHITRAKAQRISLARICARCSVWGFRCLGLSAHVQGNPWKPYALLRLFVTRTGLNALPRRQREPLARLLHHGSLTSDVFTLPTFSVVKSSEVRKLWNELRSGATHFRTKSTSPLSMWHSRTSGQLRHCSSNALRSD